MSVDAAATRAGSQGDSVALFEGCIMRELFDHVHRSSRNVLALNGYELVDAAGQGCCGALHAHSGDMDRARSLARANIAAFERIPAEHVAVNAAGCGAMLKEYAALLADDADWSGRARSFSSRVADITELLEARGPLPGAPLNVTVAYDAPCHLQHAQRITSAPLALFRAIPGVTLLQSPDSDKCCGAAGIYNLIEPATSNAVLKPKLDELLESGAQVVSTGNPGCMMQIGAGLLRMRSYVQVAHPVELLDMSYRERRDG
jgi:glycolate oxidase iron-sulfur subunit